MSAKAFNDMMEQFLEELVLTFPNEGHLKRQRDAFEIMKSANERLAMKAFMKNVKPFAEHIMSRNEKYFLDNPDCIEGLNMTSLLTDVSDATKDAIWQYLQTLYIFGNTMSVLPEETVNMIDTMAQKFAQEKTFDPNALMKDMSLLFQGNNRQSK